MKRDGKNVVVYAGDNKYAMMIGVSLFSLLKNNTHLDMLVYVFSHAMTEKSKRNLKLIAKQFEQKIIIKEMPDLDALSGKELQIGNWAKSAYLRLFMPRLLPGEYKRVLWLDGDTLVVNDLSELLKEDIDQYACAAVIDSTKSFKLLHGFKKKDPYFNSGVLLMNMEYWRKNRVCEKFLAEINRRKGYSIDPDQSYINCLLKGHIKILNPQYNVMHRWYLAAEDYDKYLRAVGYHACEIYNKDILENAIINARIYHYAGTNDFRPWFKECRHPAGKVWIEYLRKTPWKDYVLKEAGYQEETGKLEKKIRKLKSLGQKMICSFRGTRLLYVKYKYGFWLKDIG